MALKVLSIFGTRPEAIKLAPVIKALRAAPAREKPDWVLIQGDTTTTLSVALAAYYQRLPVAHVEAGLRSHNPWHPYPEEFNRRLADALATLHLAPTEGARQNLLAEGIPDARIRITGNTVIDALLDVAARPYDFSRSPLARVPLDGKRVLLVTTHRRESFGAPLL